MSVFPRRAPEAGLTAAVFAATVVSAAALWAASVTRGDGLWRGFYHDRHGHFGFALDLALAARSLDPIGFVSELEKAKIWPPVHGLVLSVVLLIGGLDHRLGVVPSLVGWSLTVMCVWLITRRLFANMSDSALAGVIAVSLTMVSPAFRTLASDVMLEGLGAGLSALAILLFIRAWGRFDAGAWRPFALALTVLFFEKGNYWGLVVLSALLTWFVLDRESLLTAIGRMRSFASYRFWRDPLTVGAVVLLVGTLLISMRGPTVLELAGQPVSLYPPRNMLTAAYWLLFVRCCLEWRKHRETIRTALGGPGRALCRWHALPVAVSFLLPQRLATFLWFVSPLNTPGEAFDPARAVRTYWAAFEGFHVAPWAAVVVVVLFAVALVRLRALPPAGRLVIVFGLVSTAAVILHPNRSDRFLTTFVFAYWVGAAAGLLLLTEWLFANAGRFRFGVAAVAATALLIGLLSAPPARVFATTALDASAGPSDLDLVSAYAPFTNGHDPIGIAATTGGSRLLDWPILERCRCRLHIETFAPIADSRDAVRSLTTAWLERTPAGRIVLLDLPQSGASLPALGWTYDRMAGIVDAAAQSERFGRVATVPVPSFGGLILIFDRR